MPTIKIMKDISDSFVIKKDGLDSVSFRSIICGKSGVGKTNIIGSLLCLKENYSDLFLGKHIFIFSPLKNDFKMESIIKFKSIPKENVFTEYNDDILNNIYDEIVDDFESQIENKKIPNNYLILLDDVSFDGSLKKGNYNAINRCFMNIRKHCGSILISSQKYSQISTGQRSNASSVFFFNSNMKERELFEADNNYIGSRKAFFAMLEDNLKNKRDFIYVNYSVDTVDKMYRNSKFELIDINKYKLK